MGIFVGIEAQQFPSHMEVDQLLPEPDCVAEQPKKRPRRALVTDLDKASDAVDKASDAGNDAF